MGYTRSTLNPRSANRTPAACTRPLQRCCTTRHFWRRCSSLNYTGEYEPFIKSQLASRDLLKRLMRCKFGKAIRGIWRGQSRVLHRFKWVTRAQPLTPDTRSVTPAPCAPSPAALLNDLFLQEVIFAQILVCFPPFCFLHSRNSWRRCALGSDLCRPPSPWQFPPTPPWQAAPPPVTNQEGRSPLGQERESSLLTTY